VPIKTFELIANFSRAKEIVTVLARNGFADLLQRLDLPPQILRAFGTSNKEKLSQWERVREVLEQLGPTFIKFGQLLSMRPDVVPEALISELRKLQESVPPDDFDAVRPVIEGALEASLEETFESFDQTAAAGASMAQVHFAVLKETREEVAVKVRRPGLGKTIDADFDILMWFAQQAHERIEELKPYDLPGVVETLRRGLEKEIDFRNEARSLAFFALQNPYPESVHAPKIYEELCSKRVLVMERIDGKRLSELEADTPESKQIADNGSRSLFHQILITGFFHADPHEGNLRLMPDGRLCLLDWGLVGQLTRRMRYGLVDLFLAFIQGNAEKVVCTAVNLADSGSPIDERSMEREVMVAMREHYNPETGVGNIGRAILQLLYIFGRNGIDLAREYSLTAKAILCVEEMGSTLNSDYNLKDAFEPVLIDLMKERRNPARLLKEARDSAMQGMQYLQSLPDELRRILKKIEKDSLKVNLQHKGLEELDYTISDASNKITLGIIIGCLIVGSSLVITTDIPPLLFGIPVIGWIGYVISMILGIWVAFDIIRGSRKR
jgi:ubiquinone biosynthesis protein